MTLASQFLLDPSVTFLNHGSFGATPRPVLDAFAAWQLEMERRPVEFLDRRRPALLLAARQSLGRYLSADAADLVFVTNATFGVNVVARSLQLGQGDEVLGSNHEYGAVSRTFAFLSHKQGFEWKEAEVGVPVKSARAIEEAIISAITPRTRLLVLSHITSPTALILPVASICKRARAAGVLTLIDGAHAPGQIPLSLDEIGADFYTGNLHKWLCAPKGSAFLHARKESQELLDPLVVSWGFNRAKDGPAAFIDEQELQGTRDYSAFLAVEEAIRFQERNSWDEVRWRGHELAAESIRQIAELTGLEPYYAPESDLFGQMAAHPLPDRISPERLKSALYDLHRIEIPVYAWLGKPVIRASFQAYNSAHDLETLLGALAKEI